MMSVYSRKDMTESEDGCMAALDQQYGDKSNLPYYDLMMFLINLDVCRSNQIAKLKSLFKPAIKKEWDYNIGFPKDADDSTPAHNIRSSSHTGKKVQAKADVDNDEEPERGISSFTKTVHPDIDQESSAKKLADTEQLDSIDREKINRPSDSDNRQPRYRSTNQPTRVVDERSDRFMRPGLAGPGYQDRHPSYSQVDNDLTALLRKRMSQIISRFIDAVVDDDARIENKTHVKVKLNAIVNRKCQNLLTSIFAGEKPKFQKLLMMKVESSKDAIAVDDTFDRFDLIKSEGLENLQDKRVNDFLKGLLKVDSSDEIDYLANHISNLIMYTTTPLEDIVRYK